MESNNTTESSALSLELLQSLEKPDPKVTPKSTSPSPQTPVPTKPVNENASVFLESKRTKSALGSFEDAIGGRQVLIDTLSMANLDKKQEYFLRMISDPMRERDTLAKICLDSDMLPSQIIDLFRTASFAKAHAIGMGVISEAVPAIMRDIAEKSVDREVICPTCNGMEFPQGVCQLCNGKGTILRESDLDRQKLALETSGMLKKGGGVNVQVNQQVGVMQPGAFFSKFVKQSDQTAYDIEVIDVKPEEKVG